MSKTRYGLLVGLEESKEMTRGRVCMHVFIGLSVSKEMARNIVCVHAFVGLSVCSEHLQLSCVQ